MKTIERFYWFRRNLFNFILLLIFVIPYGVWLTVCSLIRVIIILFDTSGSEVITPPWRWKWWEDEE